MKFSPFLILIIFFLSGCQSKTDSGKDIISVSILPQKYLAEKIAGNKYQVNVLVPPGVSPETYELSPLQMKLLADSRVYFITGHLTFEQTWKEKFKGMNRQVRFTDLSEGIDLISSNHAHDDHYHSDVDPHVWISPKTFKIMAENMYKTFREIDPESQELYDVGYQKLLEEISSADSILSNLFSQPGKKAFLIFHPALGYLARDYGLEQIPVEFEGKSPPPAYIQNIINISRENNISTILIQKEFSVDNARAIAREINGDIIQIDPLDEDWYEQILFIGNTLNQIFNKKL